MQKKTFIILIISIVFLGILGFFLVANKGSLPRIQTEEKEEPAFRTFEGLGGFEDTSTDSADSPRRPLFDFGPRETLTDFDQEDSKLVQITGSPVSGFTLFSKTIEIVGQPQLLPSESLVETYNFLDFPSMKIGDTGDGVKALQTVLNRQATTTVPLEVSGTFDTATKNALIAFQNFHKLSPDGIAGTLGRAKLNEVQGLSTIKADFEPKVTIEIHPTIRYQEKSNGHIFDFGINDGKFSQISETSFSAVHESFFGNNGDTLVARYANNDTILTFMGDIVSREDGTGEVSGTFLPIDIPFVSISPSGAKMVYSQIVNRTSKGYIMDLATKSVAPAFNSKFTEWIPYFNGDDTFSLTTRASALASGFSYVYDATKKDVFTRGVGGYTGLTTLYNPAGTKVLYSSNNGGRFVETFVQDLTDGSILSLGIQTLAEKCVWQDLDVVFCAVPRFISAEDYPDAWYKGEVSFNDRIWSVDTENGLEKMLSTLRHDAIDTIDVVNPQYQNGILLLQNKDDMTLWMLDLR